MYEARIGMDQTIKGLWAPVYEKLYEYLTELNDSFGSGFAGIDSQTLLWLAGARFVNAGEGPFGSLIRDYTIIQHRLRYGFDPTEAEMDGASNAIARAFLGQWLGYDPFDPDAPPVGGSQPDIVDTGLFDAGPAAAQVFNKGPEGEDAAGWAGTLLFANLGAPDFWRRLVNDALEGPQSQGQYTSGDRSLTAVDRGSYNAIAAAGTLQEFNAAHAFTRLFDSWEVFFGTLGGLWNQLDHSDQVAALKGETTAKFLELYGLSAGRGEPSPDIGADIFGALGSSIFLDIGKDAHYTVGSLGNDVIGYSAAGNGAFLTHTSWWDRIVGAVTSGSRGDVLNAGRGDDTVYGTTGSDILDGGEDSNTLIYLPAFWSGPFSNLSLSFDAHGKFDSRAVVSKTSLLSSGKDVAVNFDKIIFDFRSTQDTDPADPSRYRENLNDKPDAPWIVVHTPKDGIKENGELNRSETVELHGDLTKVRGAEVRIDMGRAEFNRFGQDIVDARGLEKGIYFNMGSGAVVALDQSTGTNSSLGWLWKLGGVLLSENDLVIKGANAVYGTDYSDILISNGGKAADGEGYSEVHGGGGNDLLIGRGHVSHLFGGEGKDRFEIGANTWIEDAQSHDSISYGGIVIPGGVKQWWMEGNTAYWAPFSTVIGAFRWSAARSCSRPPSSSTS
jgi:hypothetical protein